LNGYEEFKIHKNATTGLWEIMGNFTAEKTKKRFVLYTGTETAEEKEIIRNIYNGDWEYVPSSIIERITNAGYTINIYGEVIRLFMITASGSEGINLKNTRYVHILEPYWNLTRIEQIIGRARRICSHANLPEDLRTVQVFIYLTVFNEKQQHDIRKEFTIKETDTSKTNVDKIITTDETLFEISYLKNKINTQVLQAMKETAVDCSTYSKNHKDEGLLCFHYGKVDSNNFGSYPTIEQDIGEKIEENVQHVQQKLKQVTIKGVKHHLDETTMLLYTNENFINAKKGAELVPIGKLTKEGRGYKIIPI
jgi:hypothetical protein